MDTEPVFHDAFYRFVSITDVDDTAATLRELTTALTGVLLVASEGINGTLAGTAAALDAFQGALATDPRLEGRFRGITVKRSVCLTPPFQRMKVHSRPEILPLGVAGVNAVGHIGLQVPPAQWRELLDDPNVVVIDNRNHFEVRLGHFRNAVDPQVHNFRDFPAYIEAQLPIWQAEGKQVAMYCTGGIRCEKTSAWLHERGVPVLQLEGGILNYFAQMPDAERDWSGECFVFDNRIALDTRLRETGTTAEQVYAGDPDEAWRLRRAQQLAGTTQRGEPEAPAPGATPPTP
ncbi:MAG: hypothetical protein CFE40_11355 [Burkholderiales bacterium PBB1]|nr:MAG: hypothetical protein CFE40_11355 [Burkholderiales bacterium PBB1]